MRRATQQAQRVRLKLLISIHALLAESDRKFGFTHTAHELFLSTLSLRRATNGEQHTQREHQKFLSTLSLRRATHGFDCPFQNEKVFLSTLSLRRATSGYPTSYRLSLDFYPRSPCGERLHTIAPCFHLVYISIHALLAESDLPYFSHLFHGVRFLSTLSLRRATTKISRSNQSIINFYPRSPCGERHSQALRVRQAQQDFYPRSPCGERPDDLGDRLANYCISIHALLAESDPAKSESLTTYLISIHALLAESDRRRTYQQGEKREFLSTLSLRRATALC